MFVQLIYTSRLIFDANTPQGWSRLQELVSRARERNQSVGITGSLIIGSDWIAQILEGDKDAVNSTFQRILADWRHREVRLVDMRMISRRSFEGWSLGTSRRPRAEMPFELLAPGERGFNPISFDAILAMAQVEAA
jgi:Sensors of blue-light using FAD